MTTENEKAVRDPITEALIEAKAELEFHGVDNCRAVWLIDAALLQVSNTDGWVSVFDRLPSKKGWYAVRVSDPDDIGWDTSVWWRANWDGEWYSADPVEDGQPVTHWLDVERLSAAPKAPQQVSNTPQDGTGRELEEVIRQRDDAEDWADRLAGAIGKYLDVDIGEHSNLNNPWSEALTAIESPPQQEQSGEAVAYQKAINVCNRAFEMAHSTDVGYRTACTHIREDLSRLAKISTSTPTATASQESAPEAGGEARPVAYRAWLDDERGARWVFTLWPEEEHLEVIWEPLFLAPPTSTAIAARVIKQAAGVCHQYFGTEYPELAQDIHDEILSITPANAEAELEVLMKGWKEAAIAWEVCASIHREYAKGKDALFTTRQADYTRHANEARRVLDEAKGEVK